MYPQRELTRLAAYKAALRQSIALRRNQCTAAASRVAQPLELLDRLLVLWHRLSPLALVAAVPLGFLVKRPASPGLKILRSLVRWGPLVLTGLRGIRGIRSLVTTRSGSRPQDFGKIGKIAGG